jgi:hypothetical protein
MVKMYLIRLPVARNIGSEGLVEIGSIAVDDEPRQRIIVQPIVTTFGSRRI